MGENRKVYPLPQVTTVLDESEGTMAHPLPTEDYLYPPTRIKPARTRPTEAWTGHMTPVDPTVSKPESQCCRSCWLWVLGFLILAALCFLSGMLLESKVLHVFSETTTKENGPKKFPPDRRSQRTKQNSENSANFNLVRCPKGSSFSENTVSKFAYRKNVPAIPAKTAFDCKQLCKARVTCISAYYDPMNRNCHLWTDDICHVPLLESRDNTNDVISKDCVKWKCVHYKKICDCGKKKKENVFLADLWFYKSCMKVADYENVEKEICM